MHANCYSNSKIFRLGQKAGQFEAAAATDRDEVTALRPSPDEKHLAIGYANGSVRIFDVATNEIVYTLTVHRSAVNVLRFDGRGMQLVSGGQDTDLVISDMVAQVGRCRLTGHTAPVTDACFYERTGENIVISASKDTRIKFWNVDTRCCLKTIVDHRSDIWGISLMRGGDFLITGSGGSTLNVYKMTAAAAQPDEVTAALAQATDALATLAVDTEMEQDDLPSSIRCSLVGSIQRVGKGRTVGLCADASGRVLACHGTDDLVELFLFNDEAEAERRVAKRMKKLKKANAEQKTDTPTTTLSDEVRRLSTIRTECKVKSLDLYLNRQQPDQLSVAVSFADNYIKMFGINVGGGSGGRKNDEPPVVLKSLTQLGHHSEVRAVAFSSDGMAIASGSGNSLKLWNRESMASVLTVNDTGYVLCCCFVPGDRHVLLGLKSGALLIVDIVVGEIVEQIGTAHTAELWTISLMPDQKGCVTGGGDQTVKLWSFELIADGRRDGAAADTKVLSLLHKNTLKLEETIFCVRISANSKFVTVGLLDATVKIFFLDTFKLYLSLYGHKLPVLCLDISDDSAIIATGSADRNVKIWGMDFGNCHRSLFAHDDSVMALQFIPRTHMFWTCGKDGRIKQWDGDTFVKIINLAAGHIGEAYSLAVDPSGHHLVTCGSDRVIRLFERTQETIVLKDAQEEERARTEATQLATGDETDIPGLPNLKLASRKTVGSERAAESILECLEVGKAFDAADDASDVPPLMRAYAATNSTDYLIAVLTQIRSTDLEETVLLLPFSAICELLERVPTIADRRKDQTELICKVVLFAVRIHQKPIVGNHALRTVLHDVLQRLSGAIVEMRDLFGQNGHALQMLQRDIEARDGVELFRDVTKAKKKKDKTMKKRHLTKRLHIQMH